MGLEVVKIRLQVEAMRRIIRLRTNKWTAAQTGMELGVTTKIAKNNLWLAQFLVPSLPQ